MQRGNPFYVTPAGQGVGSKLAGIGNIIGANREKKKQDEAFALKQQQQKAMQAGLLEAYNTGNPQDLADFAMANPAAADQVTAAFGFQDDIKGQQKEEYSDYARQVLANPTADNLAARTAERIAYLQSQGRDASQSIQLMEELQSGVPAEEAVKAVRDMYIMNDPEGWNEYREATDNSVDVKNVQRSVEVPGQGFNMVLENGSTEFTPYSVEQALAYGESQRMSLEQAGRMAGASATGAAEATARQALINTVNGGALAARESMPRIRRLEELADIANTGFAGDWRVRANRALGRDVAKEEEFMALSNQEILAAADSLKGALSDRENEYLEAVGPGIGKSREGNARIINNIAVIAQNAIDRQAYLKQWNEDGKDPSEFYFEGKPFNDTAETIEEGTLIENAAGERQVWRNGGWVDY